MRSLAVTNNTIHFVDSLERLFGLGDNPNGEVGNGIELVNHFERYATPLAWSWGKNEFQSGAPAIQIGADKTWKSVWGTGGSFDYYNWALDVNDSSYFWGRNKSFVGGDGAHNAAEGVYPNALDVLKPTQRTPMGVAPTQTTEYSLSLPLCNGGPDQVTNSTSVNLSATATPTILAATGKMNYGYTIAAYKWNKISGPPCTIVAASSASTAVTGMSAGVYQFQMLVTDNNTATWADTVKVTITTAIPAVNVGPDQTISLPTNTVTLTGSAVANGGATLTNLVWTKTAGPEAYTILSPGSAHTAVTDLVAGTYVFTLTATDSNGNKGSASVSIAVNPLPSVPDLLIFHKFFKKIVK
jgi:hypothetical protein